MTITVQKEMDFNDLEKECWSGAIDTLKTIREHDMENELMQLLDEVFFCDGEMPTLTAINDLLWFDDGWVFDSLGINPEEDDDEDDDEDWDDWDNDPTIDEEHDGDRFDFPERF